MRELRTVRIGTTGSPEIPLILVMIYRDDCAVICLVYLVSFGIKRRDVIIVIDTLRDRIGVSNYDIIITIETEVQNDTATLFV
jgi:hypothetical protein